ncbi:MAG: NAD(P)H-hydrate epimerase [Phycisphaerae bacterium]
MPIHSLTREQSRSIDQCAIETVQVPGVVLMENAGRNCADEIERFLKGLEDSRIAVVCGAGNNGGDGYVIARHLSMRGAEVAVLIVVPEEKIKGDAETNLRIIRNLELDVRFVEEEQLGSLAEGLESVDLIVDAVGGTGISGALRGSLAEAVEQMNSVQRPIVAVDIPTGLDCDSGRAEGPATKANLTITMVARKKGYDNPDSQTYTGEIVVADIGVPLEKVAQLRDRNG